HVVVADGDRAGAARQDPHPEVGAAAAVGGDRHRAAGAAGAVGAQEAQAAGAVDERHEQAPLVVAGEGALAGAAHRHHLWLRGAVERGPHAPAAGHVAGEGGAAVRGELDYVDGGAVGHALAGEGAEARTSRGGGAGGGGGAGRGGRGRPAPGVPAAAGGGDQNQGEERGRTHRPSIRTRRAGG